MGAKKSSPAEALKAVIETLDSLEASEKQWVLQSAANLWSVTLASGAPGAAAGSGSGGVGGAAANLGSGANGQQVVNPQDPKSFIKLKNPQSETQRVTCLAYFLSNFRNTPAFKAKEIIALNTESRGPAFNVPRAVNNAANAKHKYLSSVGQGQKQITAHGEEVVEALPDLEKLKEVEARKATKRGRPKKRGKSKAS